MKEGYLDMRKNKKGIRYIAMILSFIIIFCNVPAIGFAATGSVIATGSVGVGADAGGAPWRLYSDGTLVVESGFIRWTGLQQMPMQNSPWNAHRDNILRIVFTGSIVAGSDLAFLFANLQHVESIEGLEHFENYNVVNMRNMFSGMQSLTSLDLVNFDTTNVESMYRMFSGTRSLSSIDLSNFYTRNVTNMSGMFAGSGATSINLINFDTSSVTDMSMMFLQTANLLHIDLSSFNTSNVTNMSSMFGGDIATGLTYLDLSSFDTSNVVDMSHMFRNAENLTSINLSSFDTGKVNFMQGMFARASSLTNLDLSHFNTRNVSDMGNRGWGGGIDAGFSDAGMFSGMSNLTYLNLSGWDTGNVQGMGAMFAGASSLVTLDLSHFDTRNVTSMSLMFQDTNSLMNLNLSGWDTRNVYFMSGMFRRSSSLVDLDLSNWNVSNLEGVSDMFSNASNLTNLNLSGWNTLNNMSNMRGMFENTSNLTNLDLSGWNTSNVRDMSLMFAGASSLVSLDLSHFDTNNVLSMMGMFERTSSLATLYLTDWETSNVVSMRRMFAGASGLEKLDISSFSTSNLDFTMEASGMNYMFPESLRQLSLGEQFRFLQWPGTTLLGYEILPGIVSNDEYTGRWQNVGIGTIAHPQGEHVFTSAELVRYFDGTIMADTWVRQRQTVNIPVTGVFLNFPTGLDLIPNQSQFLEATIQPYNATNQTVSWSSAYPHIASVNENGLVTAHSLGTTIITVTTADGNFTASREVIVSTNVRAYPPIANPVPPTHGRVPSGTLVSLTSATPNARIHFTLNGSIPTRYSPLYTSSIYITGRTVISAIAYLDGMLESSPQNFIFDIYQTVATPIAEPSAGSLGENRRITLFTPTEDASIRFTVDGSEPTVNSPLYLSPILVDSPMTIRARAFRSGWLPSDVVTFSFNPQVLSPVATVRPFHAPSEPILYGSRIALTSPTVGTTIRFSDGSGEVEYTEPIILDRPMTIQARAIRDSWEDSTASTFTFNNVRAITPTASHRSGSVMQGTEITLSTLTSGADIRFTMSTDGTLPPEPNESSQIFSGSIPITYLTTIRARAFRNDLVASETVNFVYDVRVSAPTSNHRVGSILTVDDRIYLFSDTEDATIFYTIDDSLPIAYTVPFQLPQTGSPVTIRAWAQRSGMVDSTISTFIFTHGERVATPTLSSVCGTTSLNLNLVNGNRITLNTSTPNARIHFTRNGLPPTERSPFVLPGQSIEVNTEQTIRAIAFAPGMATSQMAEIRYTIGVLRTIELDIDSLSHTIPSNVQIVGGDRYTIDFGRIPATVFYHGDRVGLIIGHNSNDSPWGAGRTHEQRVQDFRTLRGRISRGVQHPNDLLGTGVVHHRFRMPDMFANPRPAQTMTLPPFGLFSQNPMFHIEANYSSWIVGYIDAPAFNPSLLSGRISIAYLAADNVAVDYSVVSSALKRGVRTIPVVGKWISLFIPSISDSESASDKVFYNGNITVSRDLSQITPHQNFNIASHAHESWRLSFSGLSDADIERDVNLSGTWNIPNNTHNLSGDFTFRSWNTLFSLIFGGIRYNERISQGTFRLPGYGGASTSAFTAFAGINSDIRHHAQPSHGLAWTNDISINLSESTSLIGTVGSETTPLMAEANGQQIMIFVTYDDMRDNYNRAILMYSIFNEGSNSWSNPQAVRNDGTADFFPSINSDGTNIWISWHNSNRRFNANDSIYDILAASEITVARFDSGSNSFVDFIALTDDEILNTRPQIAVNGGEVFVVWVQNENNDILGTGSFSNKIVGRHFVNGVWEAPIEISENLGSIIDMDVAHFRNRFHVAYVTDIDNNLETINDRNLIMRDLNGVLTDTIVSNENVNNPKFTFINGSHVLSWHQGGTISAYGEKWQIGNIRYKQADGQINNLFETPNLPFANYRIINDSMGRNTSVVYSRFIGNTGFLVARIQDNGIWSAPFVLDETGGYVKYFDGIRNNNGDFNIVINNSHLAFIGEGYSASLVETNTLNAMLVSLSADISLENILYFPEDVQLGQGFPMNLIVRNFGGITVNSVDVLVNGVFSSTLTIPGGLRTGEVISLEFNLPISSSLAEAMEFVISVEPTGHLDIDMSDNSQSIVLGLSNLEILLDKQYHQDYIVTVQATVNNTSDFSANATVLVRKGNYNGEIIDFHDIGTIIGRGSETIPFELDRRTLVPNGVEYEVIFFEVVSDVDELFLHDNFDFIVLSHVPIQETYSISFMANDGGAIAASDGRVNILSGSSLAENSAIVFTATPEYGNSIYSWSVNSAVVDNMWLSYNPEWLLTDDKTALVLTSLQNNVSVTVSFGVDISDRNMVTVTSVGGNSIGYNAIPTYAEEGEIIALYAGENPGYEFVEWTSEPQVDFLDANDPETTFTMISEPVTVTANWRSLTPIEQPITIYYGGTGATAYPNPAIVGEYVTLDAGTPPPGQTFVEWTTGTTGVIITNSTSPTSATFVMVNEPVTIVANWTPILTTYTATINPMSMTFFVAQVGYSNVGMEQVFVIENTGTGQIINLVASLVTDGFGGSDFEIVQPLSANTLNPGETTTITVRPINGLGVGNFADALLITGYNDINLIAPLSFMVSMEPVYGATISPTSMTFATVQEGYSNFAMDEVFTVTNTGTEDITGLTASLGSSFFEISEWFPYVTVTSGSALSVSVRPVEGLGARNTPYTDVLTVTGDNIDPLTVPLSFTVSAIPTFIATITPNNKTFPDAQEGYSNAGRTQIFTIENVGSEQITGLIASLDSNYFEINMLLPSTSINPGDRITIGVRPINGLNARYAPYTANLTIVGNNGIYLTAPLSFTVTTQQTSILFGDVNNDGVVDSADLVLMLRFFAQPGVVINLEAADVNGDGVIDSADLILLLRFFAQPGIILGPPKEED